MIKVVSKLYYKGREFYITQHESGLYMSVPVEYVVNGVLTKTINGIKGHARDTIAECIRSTQVSVDVEELIAQGHSLDMALEIVINNAYMQEV